MEEKTVYDDFEIEGKWYLPSNPENLIPGVLKYTYSEIVLKLYGSFYDFPSSLKENTDSTFQVVLGHTVSGNITLLNGFLSGITFSESTSTFNFSKMIKGVHFNTIEDAKLDSLEVNYSYLEEWLGVHPFEQDFKREEETGYLKEAKAVYNPPVIEEFYIKSLNTTLKTSYGMNFKGSYSKYMSIKHLSFLNISPHEAMNINWFINVSNRIQELLTLFMNRTVNAKIFKGKYISIDANENETLNTVYIYVNPHHKLLEKEISLTDRYIKYSPIKSNLEKILNNWFKSEEIRAPLKKYLLNINTIDMDWENEFLNYAKALESLHRNTNGETGKFIDDEEYTSVKDAMISAIPENVSNDLRNKLSSTLKYAHHYGFERRLRELLKLIPEDIKDKMFDSPKRLQSFARDITASRDYYTHYGDMPSYYFSEWDLYLANRRLHTILFYHLNKVIGVEDDLLTTIIIQNDRLIRDLKKAKEILPN